MYNGRCLLMGVGLLEKVMKGLKETFVSDKLIRSLS